MIRTALTYGTESNRTTELFESKQKEAEQKTLKENGKHFTSFEGKNISVQVQEASKCQDRYI